MMYQRNESSRDSGIASGVTALVLLTWMGDNRMQEFMLKWDQVANIQLRSLHASLGLFLPRPTTAHCTGCSTLCCSRARAGSGIQHGVMYLAAPAPYFVESGPYFVASSSAHVPNRTRRADTITYHGRFCGAGRLSMQAIRTAAAISWDALLLYGKRCMQLPIAQHISEV